MHHDNFDLWDSAHQPWNSVNIGPKRGIVEGWKAAAERHEMRFGLAFHGDYALWWFQVSGGARGVSSEHVMRRPCCTDFFYTA